MNHTSKNDKLKAKLQERFNKRVVAQDLPREQRRSNARAQARLDKKANRQNQAISKERTAEFVDAMKRKAISLKHDEGIDKMYFCFNTENMKDSMVINYLGSESLKQSLGTKTDITLDNGLVRLSNIVVYAEVSDDDTVTIETGNRLRVGTA